MLKRLKDKNKRRLLYSLGYKRICLDYIKYNLLDVKYNFLRLKLDRIFLKVSISKLNYCCVMSFRSSSVFSYFKLSRIKIKNLASYGNIIGLKKSS